MFVTPGVLFDKDRHFFSCQSKHFGPALIHMQMQQALWIARAVFPDYDDETLMVFIWEWTGFPMFWDGDPSTCLLKQLERLRDHGVPDWYYEGVR